MADKTLKIKIETRALSELAAGPIGAARALVDAYGALRDQLQEVDQQAEALNAEQLEAHRAAVEALKTAWINNAVAWQKYSDAIQDAGEGRDPLAAQLKLIQEVSAAHTAAHLKRVQELQAEQILRMKAQGATESQIRVQAEANRRENEGIQNTSEHEAQERIQHDIDERKKIQPGLVAAAKGTAAKATAAQQQLEQAHQAHQDARHAGAQDAAEKKAKAAAVDAAAAEDAARIAKEKARANQDKISTETTGLGAAKRRQAEQEMDQEKQAMLNTPAAMESNQLITLGQLAQETGKTYQQIEGLLQGILDHHYQLQATIDTLWTQLQTLKQQQQANGYGQH